MARLVLAIIGVSVAAVAATPAPLRLPRRLPDRTLNVPVLLYHRVGKLPIHPGLDWRLTIQKGAFDAQMEWLHRNGFHAITPLELFDALEWGRRLPPRPVLLTFDDGYSDVL